MARAHRDEPVSVLTTARPRADMVFTIDFRRDVGSVGRVFAATHHFIVMCEKMDAELGRCVGLTRPPRIEIVSVELGSMRAFLRNVLEETDDSAIRDKGAIAFINSFLIVGKRRLIDFFDASDHLQEWERAAKRIHAAGTNDRPDGLPPFQPPRRDKLLNAVKHYEAMKKRLRRGDEAFFETRRSRHRVRRSARVNPRIIEELMVAHRSGEIHRTEVIVKKPDFRGSSKWGVYFQGQLVQATIAHDRWLHRYQDGKIELRPKDGLDCRMRVEECYARDGRWLFTRYCIDEVLDVVPARRHK